MSLSYTVERFRKEEDRLDSVVDVTSVGGECLAQVFDYPLHLFVDGYAIHKEHAEALTVLTGIAFDLAQFDYFLDVTRG